MIQLSCALNGLGCLIYTPNKCWAGNEVQKRQAMLDLTLSITTDEDWWILWDADFHLDSDPIDLKPFLDAYVGGSGIHQRRWGDAPLTSSPEDAGWYPVRVAYRCVRGMHLTTNHYTYRYPDGKAVVMSDPKDGLALDLPVRIRHLPEKNRPPGRRDRQIAYYERREAEGIES